VSVVLTDISRK